MAFEHPSWLDGSHPSVKFEVLTPNVFPQITKHCYYPAPIASRTNRLSSWRGFVSDKLLADRAALQDIMLTYAASVDEGRFDVYGSCFADDVEVLGFTAEPLRGRDSVLKFVKTAMSAFAASQHSVGPSLITIDGSSAHARTSVRNLFNLKEPEDGVLMSWGTFETDFERIEDTWKITKHQLLIKGAKTL
jgi:hypothetical protein